MKITNPSVYRFPRQRDPRAASSLFDSYDGNSRPASKSPGRMSGYGYGEHPNPGGGGGPYVNGGGAADDASGGNAFRGATPNSKYVCPAGMALQTG